MNFNERRDESTIIISLIQTGTVVVVFKSPLKFARTITNDVVIDHENIQLL